MLLATLMFLSINAYVYEYCDQKEPMPKFDIDEVMLSSTDLFTYCVCKNIFKCSELPKVYRNK